MSIDIQLTADGRLRLDDLPATCQHCALPRGESAGDVASEVRDALAAPIDFPPLAAAVLPGDSVAIAVDPSLPQLATLVATLVRSLVEEGAEAQRITIALAVGSDDAVQDAIRQQLPAEWADDVVLVVHDPESSDGLAYLGDTRRKRRVDLCRALLDADVLISLGRYTPADTFQSLGVHGVLYPTFAAVGVQRRYRRLATVDAPRRYVRQAREEVAEVARLAGAIFTVQVVPGRGDEVLGVLAGATRAVAARAEQLCRDAWSTLLTGEADLVIATIAGESGPAGWDELARGLATASRAATADGAIAVCCRLDAALGEGLAVLTRSENFRDAAEKVRQLVPLDAVAAMQLAHVLARHDVYLLSGLNAETVEQLGIVPLADASELARLARRFESTTIIENAELAVVTIDQ